MKKRRRFSDGFLEPILWGLSESYTVDEIAAGLELDRETVVAAVLEVTTLKPVRVTNAGLTIRARDPHPVNVHRHDWAYSNWVRSRRAATEALDQMDQAGLRRQMK